MNLSIKNFSSVLTAIEIYALDPAQTSTSPILPTYSVTISSPPNTTGVTVLWPRSPNSNDVIDFFAATNDGTGPANVTRHTPSGSSLVQVKLEDDGSGGLVFAFVG